MAPPSSDFRIRFTDKKIQVAKYDKSQIKVYDPQNCSKVYIINKTASGKDKHKVFCGRCGCTLWTIPQLHNGDKLILRTALLGEGSVSPEEDIFDADNITAFSILNPTLNFLTLAVRTLCLV